MLGALLLGSACAPSAETASQLQALAEVVNHEIVADQPSRVLVALISIDDRWLSLADARFDFKFVGDGSSAPSSSIELPPISPEFLPIAADGAGVYAAPGVVFARPGFWRVMVTGAMADGTRIAADSAFTVLARPDAPWLGDLAPTGSTPVIGDGTLPASAIDSRATDGRPVPDPELHQLSIDEALGVRPVLVVFASPGHCAGRWCAAVTDLAAELAADFEDRAAFIHVELYRDYEARQLNAGVDDWLADPADDFHQPWVYLIGADGRIVGSWDTVVTRAEIAPMLEGLPVAP